MKTWTNQQLDRISSEDELHIAPTGTRGVPVWVVRHGAGLYVRSYKGTDAHWYQNAKTSGQGRISAGGVDAEVTFIPVTDEAINDELDAAYRTKYARYGPRFLDPMVATPARDTTLKLLPKKEEDPT